MNKPVPQEYWKTRDVTLIGGSSYSVRKVDGQWGIYRKVEHDNPADYFNTALKMAKKRAMVDSILTVTAASDIFTQDLEDNTENPVIEAEFTTGTSKSTPKSTSKTAPKPTKEQEDPNKLSTKQRGAIYGSLKTITGTDDRTVWKVIWKTLGLPNIKIADLTKAQASTVLDKLKPEADKIKKQREEASKQKEPKQQEIEL